MDLDPFNKKRLEFELKLSSPKLYELIENIKRLDEQDMKTDGHLYKHMIFTDVKSPKFGVKIVASVMSILFNLGIKASGRGFEIKEDNPDFTSFGILMSKPIFNRNVTHQFIKKQLTYFNDREENVYGKNMRFIILDQSFKEGIDLYDLKYVHLLDNFVYPADEKQAIGRGTRFCGQKGLNFVPNIGWTLNVYKYNLLLNSQGRDSSIKKGNHYTIII